MFLLLSTSDTDLLSARAANETAPDVAWRYANPARLAIDDLPGMLEGADLVVVRLLGGRRAWEEGLDVLLADEPTGNLDSRTGESVLRLFDDLHAGGLTLIVVTHGDDVAARARRVAVMADGVLALR